MTLDPRKDGLKLLELRPGIEVVELRKNAALAGICESAFSVPLLPINALVSDHGLALRVSAPPGSFCFPIARPPRFAGPPPLPTIPLHPNPRRAPSARAFRVDG